MTVMDRDSRGFPILLATEGKQATTDTSSDKTSGPPVLPSTRPANVDVTEWARRMDAVRDAAREFDSLSAQDLRERLRGATTKPLTDADLEQFKADVRAAELDDLVDVLDQGTRGKLRGRRTVRVNAPRGYIVRALRGLAAEEADAVESRLRSRGWDDKQVKAGFRSRIKHLDQDHDQQS